MPRVTFRECFFLPHTSPHDVRTLCTRVRRYDKSTLHTSSSDQRAVHVITIKISYNGKSSATLDDDDDDGSKE